MNPNSLGVVRRQMRWFSFSVVGWLLMALVGCQKTSTQTRIHRLKQFPKISSKVAGNMMREHISTLHKTLKQSQKPSEKINAWRSMLHGMRPLVASLRSYQLHYYLKQTGSLKKQEHSYYAYLPDSLRYEQKAIEQTAQTYIATVKMAMKRSQKQAERAMYEATLEERTGVPKKILRRPKKPKKRVRRASRRRYPSLSLQFPMPGYKVGSRYGWRRRPRARGWGFHTGVDIGARRGRPIRAAASGTVLRARYMGSCGYGVILRHRQFRYKRVTTTYCHMSRILVRRGQKVRRRQVIGRIGSTGNSTGPHLHFAIHINGRHVNPMNHFRSLD